MFGSYGYDIALSFAGEQREYVHSVWSGLRQEGLDVFYDDDPDVQAKHLGERFSELAQKIYGTTSRYVALFCSAAYVNKEWPFFESTAALERARKTLFRDGSLFIGKFDDSELPGFPKDIWYTDLRKKSPTEYADLLAGAMRRRRHVDQTKVFAMLDGKSFAEAIAYLDEVRKGDKPLSYEDTVFVYLNRACACSLLAEQDTDSKKQLLDRAINDLSHAFALVARARPDHVKQLADLVDMHDSYLLLRQSLPKRVRVLLGRDKVNRRRTGVTFGRFGGCVAPATPIATSRGHVHISDIRVGDEVLSVSVDEPFRLRPAHVTQVRKFANRPRYLVNGTLIASETQPIYVAGHGWLCPPTLKVGMKILTVSGEYEPILSLQQLTRGDVMIIGVDDESHTFVGAGYVCHNVKT